MSAKQLSMVKQFIIFAFIAGIGMVLGGIASGWIMPLTGQQGTLFGSVVGFGISMVPAYLLIRRYGKSTLN